VNEDGITFCDPWPESGREECTGIDESHLPGQPGCVRIGADCPVAGVFPTDLPAGRALVYVEPGASSGGDGSISTPYATISEALTSVIPGTTVVLSLGTHTVDGVLMNVSDVELRGACVAGTLITGDADATALILGLARDLSLRDLAIGQAARPAFELRNGDARLSGVAVVDAHVVGILGSTASTMTLRDVIVRNVTPEPLTGGWGIRSLGALDAERIEVSGAGAAGIRVSGGSVRLRDGHIHSQEGLPDGTAGFGLDFGDGAAVDVARTSADENRVDGIHIDGAGISTLDHVVVRDTVPTATGGEGRGMLIQGAGVQATLTNILVERNYTHGLWVARSRVQMEDIVVRDTRSQPVDGRWGAGVHIESGATGRVSRAAVFRSEAAGLQVSRATFTIEDLVSAENQGRAADGIGGDGVAFTAEADVTARRLLLVRNNRAGVSVFDSVANLEDVTAVEAMGRASDIVAGRGMQVYRSEATLTRGRFADNHELGVHVSTPESSLTLVDTVVRGTQPRPSDGLKGRGLSVDDGAAVFLERVAIEDNHRQGMYVRDVGTSVTGQDVTVRGTNGDGLGTNRMGAALYFGARMELTRVLLEENTVTGLLVYEAESVMEDLTIRGTRPDAVDRFNGRGASAEAGGSLEITRGLVSGNFESGLFALDAQLTAREIVVEDTYASACSAGPLCLGYGMGATSLGTAIITLEDFEVRRSNLCGLYIARGGDYVLERGTVSDSPIGACVLDESFDVEKLSGVSFSDNDVNLDSPSLPVPLTVVVDSEGD